LSAGTPRDAKPLGGAAHPTETGWTHGYTWRIYEYEANAAVIMDTAGVDGVPSKERMD